MLFKTGGGGMFLEGRLGLHNFFAENAFFDGRPGSAIFSQTGFRTIIIVKRSSKIFHQRIYHYRSKLTCFHSRTISCTPISIRGLHSLTFSLSLARISSSLSVGWLCPFSCSNSQADGIIWVPIYSEPQCIIDYSLSITPSFRYSCSRLQTLANYCQLRAPELAIQRSYVRQRGRLDSRVQSSAWAFWLLSSVVCWNSWTALKLLSKNCWSN